MADDKVPTLGCRFYRTKAGNEPVRDWLLALPAAVRKEIGADIFKTQWRWPIGKPLVGSMGARLHEVRSTFDGQEYRVLFVVTDGAMVLLHGFAKKTQKTPQADLAIARRRQKGAE